MTPPRASRPPALRYRPARRTDVETLADLGWRAYRVSSLEKRREFYTDHPRFGLRDVRVGELDGQIVASLVLYPFTALVRGQRLPVTGVGSVAVSPEVRRRGVGETLMRAALKEMRQRGDALSMLYAFRGSYYRRLGYGVAEMVQQLAFSPSNLPDHEERRGVRRLMLPDRPSVEALFDRAAAQGHFALERKSQWWSQRLWGREGDWVVYEGRRRGQIEGYLYYEVDPSQGPFKLSVTLEEFVAVTPEAHRGLVGYLAALRDQVNEIHFAAPADGVWPLTLQTGQNLRPGAELGVLTDTGNLSNGAMLRITDVKAALERWPLPPQARGEIALEVDDAVLPQNARSWRVSVRDGRLRLAAESAGPTRRNRLPRLRAEADLLASMLAGTISPLRAAEGGLVSSTDGATEVFERWFRARPVYLYPLNAF